MKYIAFYDVPEINAEKRYVNAAARGVIEYMIDVFSSITTVEVLSPGRTLHKKGVFHGKTVRISENAVLKIPFTFGVKTRVGRIISLLWSQFWLFFYLLFHTKRGEKVVFYHSLSLMTMISFLEKLKGIKPVIEFREIYSDINSVSRRLTKKEHHYYQCAYAFIFPSDAIRIILGIDNKPYALAPGAYTVHDYGEQRFSDGKIHCVYAGNLRREKGGAFLAIKAAKLLNEDYVVHILGNGSVEQIEAINEEINNTKTKSKIIYDGFYSGEDFYRFISRCQIGLATQQTGSFSNTSFPSKILSYMGCGLKVVCPNIDSIKESPISDYVNMYDEKRVASIAETIDLSAKAEFADYRKVLRELDKELKDQIGFLFS
ncbi:MAG: glycosyltransferase [Ruminococcus sp.]|nr:glycosyltransferase [Ruminococcus sp.]